MNGKWAYFSAKFFFKYNLGNSTHFYRTNTAFGITRTKVASGLLSQLRAIFFGLKTFPAEVFFPFVIVVYNSLDILSAMMFGGEDWAVRGAS